MKILLAPDSFKGTMSSMEIIEHLYRVAHSHFSPLEIEKVPIADGGEGTVESIVTAAKGVYRKVEVVGPMGKNLTAKYGVIPGNIGVIEMAQASGLTLLNSDERNPLKTTTFGTGQLIKAGLDEGIREFIIGIGGSATNDGGIGAAQALGVSFTDSNGQEVGFGGQELSNIRNICIENLDPRIKESNISVICDVSNPLTGPNGATAIYGPQKGAKGEILGILEDGMKSYEQVIKEKFALDMNDIPGSGAAGGLGAALVVFLGGKLESGIDKILNIINFEKLLDGVNLVITGEGKIDGQSVYGKVPVGVAKRSKDRGVKVVAIVGVMGEDAHKAYDYGIDSIFTTIDADMSIEEAMENAEDLLINAADRLFRLIKVGLDMRGVVDK